MTSISSGCLVMRVSSIDGAVTTRQVPSDGGRGRGDGVADGACAAVSLAVAEDEEDLPSMAHEYRHLRSRSLMSLTSGTAGNVVRAEAPGAMARRTRPFGVDSVMESNAPRSEALDGSLPIDFASDSTPLDLASGVDVEIKI